MEMLVLGAPVGVAVLLAMLAAKLLRTRRPAWSVRRIVLLAASPLPLLALIAGAVLYARIVATLPPNACGMPLLGPMFLIAAGLFLYPVSLLACVAALRRSSR